MTYAKTLPSAKYLHECLALDAQTGELTWRKRPASHFGGCHVKARRWNGKNAGRPALRTRTHGYRAGKINGVTYFTHRVIWKMCFGADPEIIDHKNRVRSDNRPENLSSGSQKENALNSRKRPPKYCSLTKIRTAKNGWRVDGLPLAFECWGKALTASRCLSSQATPDADEIQGGGQ